VEIRNDTMGSGYFGAPRGGRLHNGIDIIVDPGQPVKSPIAGEINRVFKPYAKGDMMGIEIVNGLFIAQLMYVAIAGENMVGKMVKAGSIVAFAQNIRDIHGPDMLPHVHLQVYVNPASLLCSVV